MKKLLWRWLPVIVWLGVIFIGSSIGNVPRVGGKTIDAIVHRSAHIVEYTILGVLVLRAFGEHRAIAWRQVIVATLLCGLYGVTDEWHQAFVPGRSSELSAVIFDLGGGLIGAALYRKWLGKRKQISEATHDSLTR